MHFWSLVRLRGLVDLKELQFTMNVGQIFKKFFMYLYIHIN